MKIRTFTVTFLLFLSVFFSSLGLISVLFFRMQTEAAMERGGNEHYLISDTMGNELKNLMERGAKKEDAIRYLFEYYSAHYAKQKGYLEIFREGELIYGSFPSVPCGILYAVPEEGSRTAVLKKLSGREYVVVAGGFPRAEEYQIQYLYDITSIIAMWKRLRNTLWGIGTVFSVLAAFLLMLLLDVIFRPFSQVVTASREIAGGNYEKRIQAPGAKELAVMADSFNDMADKVQEAVTELSREAEQKQQFIDNFSHEIRTPLTSVHGFAEYMQKSAVSEKERITISGYIMEDSSYILNIAERLLKLAALNNQTLVRKKCTVDVLFDGAEKLLHKRLGAKNIQLFRENKADFVFGDEELLRSLLVNLTNNAIDASHIYGSILWSAWQEENKTVLAVTDHGKGIPAEQLDKIKEPFYRVDASRNRENGNVGLGLSICWKIAEIHNAEIVLDSQLQKGTTVKVIFTMP